MTTSQQTLADCLAQQLQLAQRFLAILQEESRHLESPEQTEHLQASTAAKLECVQQFDTQVAIRNQILLSMGHTADAAGLRQALQAQPSLGDTQDALLGLAEQAKQLNAENGIIINTYLRHTQQAMTELQQLTGQAPEPLYTSSGRSHTSSPAARTHIKAG